MKRRVFLGMVCALIVLPGTAAAQVGVEGGQTGVATPTFEVPVSIFDDWANQQLLVSCPPGLPLPLPGGPIAVHGLALAPDGTAVTAVSDGAILRLDSAAGTVTSFDLGLRGMRGAADLGDQVLFSSGPELLQLDLGDARVQRVAEFPSDIRSLGLAGDNQAVVALDGAPVQLVDLGSGLPTPFGPPLTNPGPLTIGPDGTMYVALGEQILVIPVDGRDSFLIPFSGAMGVAVFDDVLWVMGPNGMVALDPTNGDELQTFPDFNFGGPFVPIPLADPFKALAQSEVIIGAADTTSVTTTPATTTTTPATTTTTPTTTTSAATTTTTATTTTVASTSTTAVPQAATAPEDDGSSTPWPLIIGAVIIAAAAIGFGIWRRGGGGLIGGGAPGSGGTTPPGDDDAAPPAKPPTAATDPGKEPDDKGGSVVVRCKDGEKKDSET